MSGHIATLTLPGLGYFEQPVPGGGGLVGPLYKIFNIDSTG